MKKRDLLLPLAVVSLLLCACGGGSRSAGGTETVALRHATLLTIESHNGYDIATIADPWDAGRTLHTYCLVPRDSALPDSIPPSTVIRTPLRRAVVTTAVHCSLLMELGCGGSIAGVCDLQYINLPWIQERTAAGDITDCGSSMSPTIERLIELQPDAIFLSPFQNSGGYGRVEQTGVPIVEMADYMESGPLARAEWMRFYGLLFGVAERADSLFSAVEDSYTGLRALAAQQTCEHTVLMDKPMNGVWYVPGGRSTIGQVISDANAAYPWADDESAGSLSLSVERVIAAAAEADVWLVRYYAPAGTQPLSADETPLASSFRAYREGGVWGCNTAVSTFYEDTPFHPDRLLRDIIIITHPGLTESSGEPVYFTR